MLMTFSIYTLAMVLLPLDLHAQTEKLRFDKLTPDEGLSHSQVTSILQDQRGFMWFGTLGGLNRYDGYQFTIYKHDPHDPQSLSDNNVEVLFEDKDGMLWIGTRSGGLNRLDPFSDTFEYWTHEPGNDQSLSHNRVLSIHQSRNGMIWVGTVKGLNRLDPAKSSFRRWFVEPGKAGGLHHNVVNVVREDAGGMIWIGTSRGLSRYDPVTDRFHDWTEDDAAPESIRNGRIGVIAVGEGEEVWIGSQESGLFLYDRDTDSFRHWRSDPGDSSSLSLNRITSIDERPDGNLWIGTWGGGVNLLDRATGSFIRYQNDSGNMYSLSNDFVRTLYEDRSGILWVSQEGTGIVKTDYTSTKFRLYGHNPNNPNSLSGPTVSSIFEDGSGILWVGTWGNGLNRVDRENDIYRHYRWKPNDPESLSDDFVRCILEGKKREGLWVGTDSALSRLNRQTGKFEHWTIDPGMRNQSAIGVVSLLEDARGRLWVGARDSGVHFLDSESNKLSLFISVSRDTLTTLPAFPNVLLADTSDPKIIWIGTSGAGLGRLDTKSGGYRSYNKDSSDPNSINSDQVQSIYEDPRTPGVLWVGTNGGGLNRFNTQTGIFRHYTEQSHNLVNNEICGLMGDDRGHLWISTARGLSRFDPESQTFRNYDVGDGLQSMEFTSTAVYKSKRGEIFFGGIRGLNAFFPHEIRDNPNPPEVVLTGFKLFNQDVEIGRGSPLKQHVSKIKSIELAYWENDISFDFAALHYTRPEKNSHAYMLKNYDQDWNDVGTTRTARYTNLDPGRYRFMVRASNSDGIASKENTSVWVTIKPPWWKTRWAYVLYFMTAILLALIIDRVQRARFIQQERGRAEIEGVRLRAEAAESHAKAAEAQAQAIQSEYKRKELERLMLEAENTRKTRELESARGLQLSMLPEEIPDLPNLELAVHMETATEVGGDYYDYKLSEDGTFTVVVGDATGHGLQAGTMVAATKSLFNALAPDTDPVRFLHKASQALKDMGFRQMYMALMLAKFKGYRVWLTSAGMPFALVYRHRSGTVKEVVLKGTPLGSPTHYPYRKKSLTLEPGDTMLLMSDGFQESFNPNDDMLGAKKVIEWFGEVAEESPAAIIEKLVNAGRKWAEGRIQDDDITFMAIKMK